jgi:hypothetical protein
VLIGPVRPVSPDSVALEHMINATGGDPVPPPGHGVFTGSRVRGLHRIPLEDVFSQESVFNIGSTQPDVDPLILFHQRTGDTASDILREAVRTQRVEGVSLPRSCFTKKGRTKLSVCVTFVPAPR